MKTADARVAEGAPVFGRGRARRAADRLLRRVPVLREPAFRLIGVCQRAWHFVRPIRTPAHRDPLVVRIRRNAGPKNYLRLMLRWLRDTRLGFRDCDPVTWFRTYLPSRRLLKRLAARSLSSEAPAFTILLQLDGATPELLRQSLVSIRQQIYPCSETLLVVEGSPAPEISACVTEHAVGVPLRIVSRHECSSAVGDYVCLMDAGDRLVPQALHRFAEAALRHQAEVLYADQVTIHGNSGKLVSVELRPAYSHDHFLATGYF